jgi:hypothetical protein
MAGLFFSLCGNHSGAKALKLLTRQKASLRGHMAGQPQEVNRRGKTCLVQPRKTG